MLGQAGRLSAAGGASDRAGAPSASRPPRSGLCPLPFTAPAHLSSVAASALRRRPTGPADAAPPSGRAGQLYELDREGAYTAPLNPAPADPKAPATSTTTSTSSDAFLDDGWGVAPVASPSSSTTTRSGPAAAKKDKKKRLGRDEAVAAAVARPAGAKRAGGRNAAGLDGGGGGEGGDLGTPFFGKDSEAGLLGLTLLQERLVEEGRVEHSPQRKARAAAEAEARKQREAQTQRRKRDWVAPEDLDEGEGEAVEVEALGVDEDGAAGKGKASGRQYFELNLEADGGLEVVDFDEAGRPVARRAPGAPSAAASSSSAAAGAKARRGRRGADEDDDPLAFLADLDELEAMGVGEGLDADEDADVAGLQTGASSRGRLNSAPASSSASPAKAGALAGRGQAGVVGRGQQAEEDEEEVEARRGLPGYDALADEEVEWGLDELAPKGQGRPSLLRDLGVIKGARTKREAKEAERARKEAEKAEKAAAKGGKGAKKAPALAEEDEEGEDRDLAVTWGGGGGASGIDMEAQELLLSRLFKPHKVKQLMEHQRAAEEELAAMKRKASGRQQLEAKVHSRMRIIGGEATGRVLSSSKGSTTRPMMEKVRAAVFSMVQAQTGAAPGAGLPRTARWLDCFAGTGAVGLEGLSRGCREAHFIELDPWVCKKVLSRNIQTCGFQSRAVVHTMKAEDFLRRSIELPRFAGGAFDFISVCPPYLVVSYPELMDLLQRSPLLHERSIVFVEYPSQLAHQVPGTLGPLVTLRDRRYGRTWIRLYGPPGGPADDDEGEEGAGSSAADEEDEELLL
ncbi:hypothetical protein HYH03_003729 [Edaphochlamys debaryana]|uniref:Uncharacterized protein n=1 Tax=Edaphochlamys debaryana TaxID=47281 RepID=A0A836C2W9_9CHLO|nr:hypothetical protein HYH03_003729 [Edaphochlamys debaryana]|eukprot:KAG2498476.1 hypothetical protein HYH03_003729 [Edaphochlamys debaryana]